jgi:hypothetical protein
MSCRRISERTQLHGRDRGAVFVEFALMVPLLLLLGMGLVEYGLGWKAANDVNAAVRDAARSGSSAPAAQTADRTIVYAIGTNLKASGDDSGIEQIIVFNASSADGQVPTACKSLTNSSGSSTSAGSRVSGSTCNIYGPGQVAYLLNTVANNNANDAPWVNSSGTGCDSSDLDYNWCPATRLRSLTSNSFNYLGVYVKYKHKAVTGFGFGDQEIERTAVFKLEPSFGDS